MQKRIRNFLIVLSMFLLFSVSVVPNAFAVIIKQTMGIWRFDEGSGNIAYDYTIFDDSRDGTIYGADWTNGKLGFGLSFNGVNDYVIIPDNPAIGDFSSQITLEAWIKPKSFPGGGGDGFSCIVTKGGAYYLNLDSSGHLQFYWYGLSNPGYHKSPNVISTTEWTHVVATYDGSYVRLYENSVEVKTVSVTGNGWMNGYNLGIGRYPHSAVRHFNGLIDEVKVYNYGLSYEEILAEYERRPVASWRLDENGGDIMSDETGNGNDGDICDAEWEDFGFSNSALSFDGVNDYVEVDLSDKPLQFYGMGTVEGWFKTDKESGNVFSYVHQGGGTPEALDDSLKIYVSDGKLNARVWTNYPGSQWESVLTAYGIKTGVWYHFAYVFDGGRKINKLYLNGVLKDSESTTGSVVHTSSPRLFVLGARGENGWYQYGDSLADYFDGLIDEVKIYKRVLRDEEIKEKYTNLTVSLLSHWSFNEGENNKVYDYGSKNNIGTIYQASWTNNAKFNEALFFNGWNAYVNCGTGISTAQYDLPITLETWIYKWSGGYYDGIIATDKSSKYAGVSMQLGAKSNNKYPVYIQFGDGRGCWSGARRTKGSLPVIEDYKWYHIVGVIKAANDMSIYIDGVDVGGSYSGTGGDMVWLGGPCIIGTTCGISNNNFYGVIDEVKIYDRALTEDEISEEAISSKTHAYGYAYASSVEPWGYQEQYFSPAFATDHNRLDPSRWSSDWTVNNPTNHDDEYIYLNFDTAKTFNTVRLDWQTAYGKEYEIQVSDNGYNWTTIHEEKNGHAGVNLHFVGPKTAKYVRMQGIKRGSTFGYSLWEFNVCP